MVAAAGNVLAVAQCSQSATFVRQKMVLQLCNTRFILRFTSSAHSNVIKL